MAHLRLEERERELAEPCEEAVSSCMLQVACSMLHGARCIPYMLHGACHLLHVAYLLLASLLEAALYDFARQEQTLHYAQTNTNIRYHYGGLPEAQSRRR